MKINREKACCFTGHRDLPQDAVKKIEERTRECVAALYARGVTDFISGGALGYDMLAAECVLAFRKTHSDVRLFMALPCKNQASGWSAANRARYEEILERADDYVYTSEKYYTGCMQVRNRFMVDNSAFCVCCCGRSSGGTAYTVKYARKSGLEVTNVFEELGE